QGSPHQGEGLGHRRVEALAALEALAELRRLGAQRGVREGGEAALQAVDPLHQRDDAPELSVVLRTEDLAEHVPPRRAGHLPTRGGGRRMYGTPAPQSRM